MSKLVTLLCIVLALLIAFPIPAVRGQVKGPIVGKAEGSDVSKPLRELAEEAKKNERPALLKEPTDEKERAVAEFLKKKYPAAIATGTMTRIESDDLAKVFPEATFFSLRFRQWPVAFEAPAGMRASNVCIVQGEKVTLVVQAMDLEKFFRSHVSDAKDPADQRLATKAWLLLSEELHQDGFYKFKPLDPEAFKLSVGDSPVMAGEAMVDPQGGNQGQIRVKLVFDGEGRVQKAQETAELKEGVRPICQATKLLDPDPLVRRMAQRDLLVMGSIAQPYVIEQWNKADPELRQAIEIIWQQVREEKR